MNNTTQEKLNLITGVKEQLSCIIKEYGIDPNSSFNDYPILLNKIYNMTYKYGKESIVQFETTDKNKTLIILDLGSIQNQTLIDFDDLCDGKSQLSTIPCNHQYQKTYANVGIHTIRILNNLSSIGFQNTSPYLNMIRLGSNIIQT